MNANDLFDLIGETPESYVLDAAGECENVISLRGRASKRVWLIAAIIAALVFLMGCGVVWYLSLQQMQIATTAGTQYVDAHGELVISDDAGRSVITVHGTAGSPAFLAAQEWYLFTENYDVDGSKYESSQETPLEIPEAYEAYSIYNQEMKDKVDEIVQRYDLNLLGAFAPFQRSERKVFYEATGISSLLRPGSTATIDKESGYFYEAGNFNVEFHMKMTGSNQWPYDMLNSIYYSKPDNFDRVYFVADSTEKWEQWAYTTSGGEDVLIAVNATGYGAKAICCREDAMIYVSIDNYFVTDWSAEEIGPENTVFMTREQLENVVDQIDFSLAVESVDIALAKEKLSRFQTEAANAERDEDNYYQGFRVDVTTEAWYPPEGYSDSFESYIPYILEYAPAEYHYYTLVDLDGNGTDELLWGTQDGYINEVAAMVDGEVTLRFDDYLCEGNILLCELNHDEYAPGGAEFLTGNFCTSYQYNTLSELIVKLYDLPDTEQWVEVRPGQEDRFISESEAKQIMAQYPIIELDMIPLSEYPKN